MAGTITRLPRPQTDVDTLPFRSAEEAWFWFIQAQAARAEGARIAMGQGLITRPCEPVDILRVIDRLYRQRRLIMDHLLVLRHYGRRMMPPDARRKPEQRAHKLWTEAMERIAPVLLRKNIIITPSPVTFLEAAE